MFYKPSQPTEQDHREEGRDSPAANKLFVAALSKSTSVRTLFDYFCQFGDVSHVEIARSPKGTSKGYGFVVFADRQTWIKVIKQPFHILGDRHIRVEVALDSEVRQHKHFELAERRLYLSGIPSKVTQNQIYEVLLKFGVPEYITTLRRSNPYSNPNSFYCYVTMDRPQAVAEILERGSLIFGTGLVIRVKKCKIRTSTRDLTSSDQYHSSSSGQVQKSQRSMVCFEDVFHPETLLQPYHLRKQIDQPLAEIQRSVRPGEAIIAIYYQQRRGGLHFDQNSLSSALREISNHRPALVPQAVTFAYGFRTQAVANTLLADRNLRFNLPGGLDLR